MKLISLNKPNMDRTLTPETMAALQELGLVLKAIHLRLKKEKGYRLEGGKLIKPQQHESQN